LVESLIDREVSLNVARSTLIYDGECSFCIRCVEWLKRITKGQVEFLPFQSSRERFPQILIKNCERSIHWIDLKGNVFEGAGAIFRVLACVPGRHGHYGYMKIFLALLRLPSVLIKLFLKIESSLDLFASCFELE